ncbi:MAG TPA: lipopolysaccharide biosynthesis protein [Chloroflexia bacterium]|jgi:PST family polysaccharide transporter
MLHGHDAGGKGTPIIPPQRNVTDESPSLGKQAAQGAIWNYAAFILSKGLLFVATLILARVLSPSEFGLVGMALLVILALDIFRDFGIGAALIYNQKGGIPAANMAFFLSTGLGVALFALNWLLAPLAPHFFRVDSAADAELMVSLLRTLGFSLLFASFGSTQDALLQKDINFRKRMVPEVGRTLVKGLLSVALALTGWGVWSLVIGQVVGEACATLLLWIVSPWRPSRQLDRKLFRPMFGYGSQIMMVNGLGTLVADIDYLIIGRLLGEASLGLYTIAYRIPEMLVTNLSQAVSNVAFPVVARLQADLAAMREAYLKMQHYMLVIVAPLGFGLGAITPTLMHILFQSRWDPAIPVMQVLSIYMVLGAVSHWPGVVYKALGRPGILNRLSFLKLAMLAPALWWAATNYGIVGVAWAHLVVRVIGILIDMWVVSRFVKIGVLTILRAIWPPVAASLVMALVVRVIFTLSPDEQSIPVMLLAIVVGAAVYAATIWVLDRQAVMSLLTLGRSLIQRRRPAPATDLLPDPH